QVGPASIGQRGNGPLHQIARRSKATAAGPLQAQCVDGTGQHDAVSRLSLKQRMRCPGPRRRVVSGVRYLVLNVKLTTSFRIPFDPNARLGQLHSSLEPKRERKALCAEFGSTCAYGN